MQQITNPLEKYLKKTGLTRDEFAQQLTKARGYLSYKSHVSNWATSLKKPSNSTRREIATATGGQVPVDAWAQWEKRKIRLAGGRPKKK